MSTIKIIVAPDSLKESLPAVRAAEAMARGAREACPEARIVSVPLADGGEGTVDVVIRGTGGERHEVTVHDPLGRKRRANVAMLPGGEAFVEMAQASGLDLLKIGERNPLRTSTYGTGELIRAALDQGARRIAVGIGGSATVDGGTGMAEALGARFYDHDGKKIENLCGKTLRRIGDIDLNGLDGRLTDAQFTVACDVANPLTGPTGAARIYAPQKGAGHTAVDDLAMGLENLADVLETQLGRPVRDLPGGGAAGGLGAGLVAFLDAEVRSGIEVVMELTGLRDKMLDSDLVLTAEGRLDGQSAFGKVVAGVGQLARELAVPVVALAGSLGPDWQKIRDHGVSTAFSICDGPISLDEAKHRADPLLCQTAAAVLDLWNAAQDVQS